MFKNLPFYFLVLFIGILFSCKSKEGNYTIKGTIKGMPEETILLEESGLSQNKFIDSATSDKLGVFALHVNIVPDKLYYLTIRGNNNRDAKIPIISDGKNINLTATWPELMDMKVTGSKATSSIINFLGKLIYKNDEIVAINYQIDSLNTLGVSDSVIAAINTVREKTIYDFYAFIKHYAQNAEHVQEALYAARMLDASNEQSFFEEFATSLQKKFPNDEQAKEFVTLINNNILAKDLTLKIGTKAPDFTLSDAIGNEISLSQFKGKYVLLDFWASWCPPCRRENPNIVSAYNRFKMYNFEIVSVSIDQNKDKWMDALKEDKITWVALNDPQEWQSPLVQLYGFDRIPSNYLISPNGEIIAKNLFGEELNISLAKILTTAKGKVEVSAY